jgi:peroxiredoxin
LVGFANLKEEFDKLGVKIVAASVDDIEKAKEVADEVNFPVAYGVTHEIADSLGAWWEDRRQIIQPSEFIIKPDGSSILGSSYSDGPLGRIDAGDVIKIVNFYESQKNK